MVVDGVGVAHVPGRVQLAVLLLDVGNNDVILHGRIETVIFDLGLNQIADLLFSDSPHPGLEVNDSLLLLERDICCEIHRRANKKKKKSAIKLIL